MPYNSWRWYEQAAIFLPSKCGDGFTMCFGNIQLRKIDHCTDGGRSSDFDIPYAWDSHWHGGTITSAGWTLRDSCRNPWIRGNQPFFSGRIHGSIFERWKLLGLRPWILVYQYRRCWDWWNVPWAWDWHRRIGLWRHPCAYVLSRQSIPSRRRNGRSGWRLACIKWCA